MVFQGRVQNGVVVLAEGVRFSEGQLVTVIASPPVDSRNLEQEQESVSPEQREALLDLIGIWKSGRRLTDDQVEQLVHQERMKKYC